MPKSVTTDLGFGLGYTPALSLTRVLLRWQLWHHMNELFTFFPNSQQQQHVEFACSAGKHARTTWIDWRKLPGAAADYQ